MLNSAGNFFPEDNRRIVWACKLPPSLGTQHYVPARRAGPGSVKYPVLLIAKRIALFCFAVCLRVLGGCCFLCYFGAPVRSFVIAAASSVPVVLVPACGVRCKVL